MNLKHQFYRGYYERFDPTWFEPNDNRNQVVEEHNQRAFLEKNQLLFGYEPGREALEALRFKQAAFPGLRQFQLEVIYPGLIMGTGYTHETGNVGELKIGFHFDHTSGLPILPGHTVKGALRRAFPRRTQPQTSEDPSIKQAKAEYIIELLGIGGKVAPEQRYDWVHRLEMQIFANELPEEDREKKNQPDIFLDAVISRAGRGGKIVGPDAITPHGSEPWRNPVPLSFLKVLPGVQWEFSFVLHSVKIGEVEITAKIKKDLFEKIFLDMGIGAKTNVGYGQFYDPNARSVDRVADIEPERIGESEVPAAPGTGNTDHASVNTFNPDEHLIPARRLKKGKQILAKVTQVEGNKVTVKLHVSDAEYELIVDYFPTPKPKIGKWCYVIIKNTQGKPPKFSQVVLVTNKITIIENQ